MIFWTKSATTEYGKHSNLLFGTNISWPHKAGYTLTIWISTNDVLEIFLCYTVRPQKILQSRTNHATSPKFTECTAWRWPDRVGPTVKMSSAIEKNAPHMMDRRADHCAPPYATTHCGSAYNYCVPESHEKLRTRNRWRHQSWSGFFCNYGRLIGELVDELSVGRLLENACGVFSQCT